MAASGGSGRRSTTTAPPPGADVEMRTSAFSGFRRLYPPGADSQDGGADSPKLNQSSLPDPITALLQRSLLPRANMTDDSGHRHSCTPGGNPCRYQGVCVSGRAIPAGSFSRDPPRAARTPFGNGNRNAFLVNVQAHERDILFHDPSPMHEARHRTIRRNPRHLHTVRRVTQPQSDMGSMGHYQRDLV